MQHKNILIISFILSLIVISPAYSQTAQDIQDATSQSQRLIEDERVRREEEIFNAHPDNDVYIPYEALKAQPVPESKLCFNIKKIIFIDSTILTKKEKSNLINPYLNTCMKFSDIDAIVRSVTNLYITKGYVTTRSYIPEQDLSSGTFIIQVVEGKLENISQSKGGEINLKTALPKITGKPLNLRDIEMGLEQINKLPSNNATMKLEPGSASGLTKIIINNKPTKRWNSTVTLDNSGSKPKRNVGSIAFGYDNLLNLNESLNISYREDLHADGGHFLNRSITGSFVVPYGYWTASGSFSTFFYKSKIVGTSQTFDTDGNSRSANFTLDRIVHRNKNGKTSLAFSADYKSYRNYIAGTLLTTSSRKQSTLGLTAKTNQRLLGGIVSASLGVDFGAGFMGSEKDVVASTSNAEPTNRFVMFNATAGFQKPFKIKNTTINYSGNLTAQYSQNNLPSGERLSVASRYTTRGFDGGSLSGDNAGYMRNELSTSLKQQMPVIGKVSPFIGLDIGAVMDQGSSGGKYIVGSAIGLRTNGAINIDLTFARAIAGQGNTNGRANAIYLELKKKF